MSVHYKFKSTLDYDTVSFDGLHISVADLKKAIFHQKRIGKNTDFDLQITNAQTKEGKSGNKIFFSTVKHFVLIFSINISSQTTRTIMLLSQKTRVS